MSIDQNGFLHYFVNFFFCVSGLLFCRQRSATFCLVLFFLSAAFWIFPRTDEQGTQIAWSQNEPNKKVPLHEAAFYSEETDPVLAGLKLDTVCIEELKDTDLI